MQKQVKLMRGLPGSGKSYWANRLFPGAMVVSTDSYFMVDGKYQFDMAMLGMNHNKALYSFISCLEDNDELIVVDNTNLKMFEIAPYYRLAEVYSYDVEIVHILADPAKCITNNVHGVPAANILAMANGVEALPPFCKVRTIVNS